ncbi:FusB/FusC family EF-G-binding protein [Saccharibacillus sp. CPCC 101409]|uniref:FusB/FusC family EF-G-binding protein n=1 Tax=Saccharibacillus sp. CPCC 101409 TaxID=3058041 RepID=UPI002670E504|nr:FusB/FusC family EF-G-binding protein [Saccharibacillus sp. CPCC 101409]MDO3410559.1 FusB/FusC family EF-G-binding protein [Saccharibacillus sp. CPCC 101409]
MQTQTPFIHNHQLNVIRKQADFLLKALRTVADRKVLETVRYTSVVNALEAFGELTEEQRELLERLGTYEAAHEIQDYLNALDAYLIPFPDIAPKRIQKLFSKVKKLKAPDLPTLDLHHTTYLRWVDPAVHRLFIVYPRAGDFVGIEGQITATNRKGYCAFCNRHQDLGFFNVKLKGSSPDNLSSVGQYVCMDDEACNHSITDPAALEKFLRSAGK